MVTVRPASPADNAGMLALARTLALPGIVRIGVDRAPDFFALDRLLGDRCHAMVAEDDEGLAGFIDGCGIRACVAGGNVAVAQVSLAAMRPDLRGIGRFRALVDALTAELRAAGYELAVGLANAHNLRMLKFVASLPYGGLLARPIRLHLLFAAPFGRREAACSIRAAGAGDLPRIDALVRAHRAAYFFAPELAPGELVAAGVLRCEDFLVACKRCGGIVATLALWDQAAWRRTPVERYGVAMQPLRVLLNAALAANRRPLLPDVGDSFRFAHVAFPAAEPGAEHCFALLLRAATRALRQRGLHFLALGLPDGDRLAPAVNGFVRLVMTAVPFLAPGSAALAAALPRRRPVPTWLEYSLN